MGIYIVVDPRERIKFRVLVEGENPVRDFKRRYDKWIDPLDEVYVKVKNYHIIPTTEDTE